MSATCGDCRWWVKEFDHRDGAELRGACRIRSVPGAFPIRAPYHWCGEHAPQPKETRDEAVPPQTVEDVLRNYVKQFVKEAGRELNVERSSALHDKAKAIEAALLILFPPSAPEESPDE